MMLYSVLLGKCWFSLIFLWSRNLLLIHCFILIQGNWSWLWWPFIWDVSWHYKAMLSILLKQKITAAGKKLHVFLILMLWRKNQVVNFHKMEFTSLQSSQCSVHNYAVIVQTAGAISRKAVLTLGHQSPWMVENTVWQNLVTHLWLNQTVLLTLGFFFFPHYREMTLTWLSSELLDTQALDMTRKKPNGLTTKVFQSSF